MRKEDPATYNPHSNDQLQDASLFVQIGAGDETAFASFYRQMVPQLRPFIFSITRSESLVEEVIQECFLRFWLNRDKLGGIADPKAWLFKITANVCYTLFRRSLTEKKALNIVEERAGSSNTETSELLHLNFLKAALQQGIQQLSPQRRKIYMMSREWGYNAEQIAAELGLSVQTVRNTLTASLESLRSHLARQGYTLSISILALLIFKR
ncbi:MAG: sigma-70 family RNA polymerase sigma factor [Chitinophagaceae bacterium]